MATINLGSTRGSLPEGRYKVLVLSAEGNKDRHIHVISIQEGFDVRFRIRDGSFLSVKKYGKRKRKDTFSDIEKLVKKWLEENSSLRPSMTNREISKEYFKTMNPLSDSPE